MSKKNKKISKTKKQEEPKEPTAVEVTNGSSADHVPTPSSDRSVPSYIYFAIVIAIAVCIAMVIWVNNDDQHQDKASSQQGEVEAIEDADDSSVKVIDPSISDVNVSIEDPSDIKDSSLGVDFTKPDHSEGVSVYHATFEKTNNDLLDTYRGLEAYDNMYDFSVAVNNYVSDIKSNAVALGGFTKIDNVTDNLSYIVEQGVSEDGSKIYQLYMGIDGSQEASMSFTISKDQFMEQLDESLEEVVDGLSKYVGIKMSVSDVKVIFDHLKRSAITGGSYTVVLSDSEATANMQVTVSQCNTSDEQWDIVGVNLVQGSLATVSDTTQADTTLTTGAANELETSSNNS